ncbi:LysE family translocator [Nonlabens ponticola]|uniref:Lysine transporter LysE n=1 Tax=Nonlabens ponticola TaxID=2496866 RepID=A0A3S9MUM7_9FLAO|nr:LysE family transporter [Nonlabens ponticola]AZQ42884.1 lysine transporter LysE [Nonlabens ponticola]
MSSLLHLLFGIGIGLVGVIPPGLLNLTAAKVSVNQGRRAAMIFAAGASLVVIAQVYIGVFFSRLISESPEVSTTLEKFAVIVFVALSIFFFIRARLDSGPEVKPVDKSDYKLFGQGVMLSALNIFPIPFYIGFSSFLAGRGMFEFKFPMAHLFIAGATIGTFSMLTLYAIYVKKWGFDSATFAKKIHYTLAALTMAIAIFTSIKIYG